MSDENGILEQSILNHVKNLLGVVDPAFDQAVITHINSTFSILYELGVGPSEPYRITSEANTWDEFVTRNDIELVKSYVYLKVKQLFDPPTVATLYEAIEQSIKELEWRLNATCDTYEVEDGE